MKLVIKVRRIWEPKPIIKGKILRIKNPLKELYEKILNIGRIKK